MNDLAPSGPNVEILANSSRRTKSSYSSSSQSTDDMEKDKTRVGEVENFPKVTLILPKSISFLV